MQLVDRRALAAELVLGALPFAGAFACMALCLPSAGAAWPDPKPPMIRALNAVPWVARGGACYDCCDGPGAWILVTADSITVGTTRVAGDAPGHYVIGRDGVPGAAWRVLEEDLRALHANYFADRTDIEIAASSTDGAPVSYQELATTISAAMHAGFMDIRVDPPQKLPDQPHHCDPEPSAHPDSEPRVQITHNGILIYAGFVEEMWVPREASDPDVEWRELEDDLRRLHTDYAVDKVSIELATPTDGAPRAPNQDLASAVAAARAAGFERVRY